MAATDKDIYQKEQSVRYCVSNDLIPFVEVNVTNIRELTEKPALLTDLDVLGVQFARTSVRKFLFDCKTAKTSPINRAFWAAGVAGYIRADEAFVILQRSAPEAHRLSAKALGVHLFDETLFESYTVASSNGRVDKESYASSINRWIKLHEVYRTREEFAGIEDFLRHSVPLEEDFAKTFRGVIGHVRQIRGELDPTKAAHNAIFCHALFSATYALVPIVTDFFDLFDPKQSKATFDSLLRIYIWGGSDSYRLRRRLRELMATVNENVSPEVELSHWEDFLEIFRMFLDSPNDLSQCCLPLLDLSLRNVDDTNVTSDKATSIRLKKSNRIRQFIFKMSAYLTKASGVPKEFDINLRMSINNLMSEV